MLWIHRLERDDAIDTVCVILHEDRYRQELTGRTSYTLAEPLEA